MVKERREMEPKGKAPLVVLIGGGSKLQPIWEYTQRENTRGNISLIVSHKAESWGVDEFAKTHNIPAFYKRFDLRAEKLGEASREEYARKLGEFVSQREYWNKGGLVVMAGWDLIMPEVFLNFFGGRVINLHPALLPDNPSDKYVEINGDKVPVVRGVHSNKAFEIALGEGHKWSGATVHFVTPKVDVGKVILRGAVPVKPGDTVATLAERVHKKEDEILGDAIDMVLSGKVSS